MIVNEQAAYDCIIKEAQDILFDNNATTRKELCDRIMRHPLIDDAYDVTWPFGADPNTANLKVKINGVYKTITLKISPAATS